MARLGPTPISALAVAVLAAATPAAAQSPDDRLPADRLPFGKAAIDYFGSEADNPVARLDEELSAGQVELRRDGEQGYLQDVLAQLGVPLESQVLVFSKTSLNERLITPQNPRALYFNDEVYVGWVPGAPALEITAVDARKGALFYTLLQDAERPPRFAREERCLLCHASRSALGVPGLLARSFETDEQGKLVAGFSRITHDTPFAKRWGGWYVTGRHGELAHRGNLIGEEEHGRHRADPAHGGNVTDLRPYFDVARYPAPHSDIVALMVLDHQVHLQNLLTRIDFAARLGQSWQEFVEPTVRYMFYADAPRLPGPVRGTSEFARVFQSAGRRDFRGRSLRDLDLKTRLPRYRLSHLVYSKLLAGLPPEPKAQIYRRLWEVLTGDDDGFPEERFPRDERRAIVEILQASHDDLPAYWHAPDAGR